MNLDPGTALPPFTMSDITLERIREFMELMHDVNPVHDDEELAARLGLRGPVNQGPANLAYVINMYLAWAGDPRALKRIDFRFLDTVTTGDVVTASGTVISNEEGTDGRKAVSEFGLDRQDGARALAGAVRLQLPAEESKP